MVLCYTVAFILMVVAVLFYTGKAASYIKGWDEPDEQNRTVKIIPLCRNLSVMFFLAAAIFAIAGVSELFRLGYFKWFIIGWIVLCCMDLVFINKSGFYVES